MALFKSNADASPTGVEQVAQTTQASQNDDLSFLGAGVSPDEVAQALQGLGSSIAYLSIAQNNSQAVKDGKIKAGVFYNSATGEEYGASVVVTPLAFKPIWQERDKQGGTVGVYEPYSIEVTKMVEPGKKIPSMTNPKTGYSVLDTYVFALASVADNQILTFTPGRTSVRQMERFMRDASMVKHPVQAGKFLMPHQTVWRLNMGSYEDPRGTYYCVGSTEFVSYVSKDFFTGIVTPALEQKAKLLIAGPAEEEA